MKKISGWLIERLGSGVQGLQWVSNMGRWETSIAAEDDALRSAEIELLVAEKLLAEKRASFEDRKARHDLDVANFHAAVAAVESAAIGAHVQADNTENTFTPREDRHEHEPN